MDKKIEDYLDKVSKGLNLDESDKIDIVNEISSHIYEAVNGNEPLDAVLKKLGAPGKLAQSYNHSYRLEHNQFKPGDILNSIAFYSSVAISGLIVISTLPIMALVFAFCAIFILCVYITNAIGFTQIPFYVWASPVTGFPQTAVVVITCIILLVLAYLCWIGLKKYLKYVASRYYKRRIS